MIYPSDKPVIFTLLSWGIIMVIFLLGALAERFLKIEMRSYLFVFGLYTVQFAKHFQHFKHILCKPTTITIENKLQEFPHSHVQLI